MRRNARTSTGARQAATALRPHASASSRFAHSSSQKPPRGSLVSKYGPSVTSTLPSGCARSDLASLAAERPPAKSLTPAASINIAHHRFGHDGRVEVVGEVNSNQILAYEFSILRWRLHRRRTRRREIDKARRVFLLLAQLSARRQGTS